MRMSKDRLVAKRRPKMSGRPTVTAPELPKTEFEVKKTSSMTTAKAKVARAR